jgi:putative endonuclease
MIRKSGNRFSEKGSCYNHGLRGHSSAGRALAWHARGRRFDPAWLHHASPFGLRVAQPRDARRTKRGARRSPLGRRRAGETRLGTSRQRNGARTMWYVYIIRSIDFPEQEYVGATADLKRRLPEHNAGKSTHTAKFKPWQLVWYCAFPDKYKALEFEKYLKSHSGRAFAKKRL